MNDEVVHCRRRVEAAWPACTAGVAKEAVYHPAMKTWHHPWTVPRNENAAKPSSTARYVKANSVRSISQCRSSSHPSPHLFLSHIFISSINSSIWKKKAQTQRKETQRKSQTDNEPITWPDENKSLTKTSLHAKQTIVSDRPYLCKNFNLLPNHPCY